MMRVRLAFVVVGVITGAFAVRPGMAEPLKPEAARQFIAGKMFAFNCFEGTRGAGYIYDDGSVAGQIQIRGAGQARYVVLPAGTVAVKGQSYCASVRGLPIEPCFKVDQMDARSFRGSISGMSFAYCDFTRRNNRPPAVRAAWRRSPSKPLSIQPPIVAEGPGE